MNGHDQNRPVRAGLERARWWCWAVVAVSASGWAMPAVAQPAGVQQVPAEIQAALVLKLLGYDRKLAERSPNGVTLVAVIGADGNEAGAKFKALEGRKIQGKQLKVALLPANGTKPVGEALGGLKANVVYLGAKVEAGKAESAIAWADQNKVPTFGGTRGLAERGAAIGFMVVKSKPRFVVNVEASRKQGIELPARVLRLAQLIK